MNRCVPVVAVLSVSVAGCSKVEGWRHPEIAACEDFTLAKLKAPTTYKRIKASTIDEQIPLETWEAFEAERLGKMAVEFRDLTKKNQAAGGVRSILLEYDAENSFGTPLRGIEICKFMMASFVDGKFETEPSADQAKLSRMIWQLDQKDTTEPSCCLTERALRIIDRAAGGAIQ